jgi:hypothetical protein
MPNVFEIHAAGVLAMQNYLGDHCPVFSFSGSEYKCNPGGAAKRKPLGAGGFSIDCDLELICHVDQFESTAEEARDLLLKKTISFEAESYRVDGVVIFPGGKLVKLECVSSAQSA